MMIIGFSTAADEGFGVPHAYAVIVAGVVVVAVSIVHFMTTKRNAIIPARVFRSRTPLFFIIASFFNSLMFMPVNFLLPEFFQGVSGVRCLVTLSVTFRSDCMKLNSTPGSGRQCLGLWYCPRALLRGRGRLSSHRFVHLPRRPHPDGNLLA